MNREKVDVADPLHPAAGDHRNVDRPREIHRRLDVAALEHPVAADVGEQQRRNAGILEAAGEVGGAGGGDVGPALGRDHAVLRIDRDDDAAGKVARRAADEVGVLQRGGADNDARDASVEPALDTGAGADAAAELDVAGEGGDDPAHCLAVAAFPCEGTVEVDDVEVARAGPSERQRLCGGVVAIDGGAVHVALGEADDLTGLEVDGGEDDEGHGRHARNRASNSNP